MIDFKSYKEACLYGYRKGFGDGLERGITMSEWWDEDNCPPANTAPMITEYVAPTETTISE